MAPLGNFVQLFRGPTMLQLGVAAIGDFYILTIDGFDAPKNQYSKYSSRLESHLLAFPTCCILQLSKVGKRTFSQNCKLRHALGTAESAEPYLSTDSQARSVL